MTCIVCNALGTTVLCNCCAHEGLYQVRKELRDFKLHVMNALDKETQLNLRAFKLRAELHKELD